MRITYNTCKDLVSIINKVKVQRGEHTLIIQRRNGYIAIDDNSHRFITCGNSKEIYQFLKGIYYEL